MHGRAQVVAGTTIMVPALPKPVSQYPNLELDITLTDERRDLIASNIDVAMWLGSLSDSDLIARCLCRTERTGRIGSRTCFGGPFFWPSSLRMTAAWSGEA